MAYALPQMLAPAAGVAPTERGWRAGELLLLALGFLCSAVALGALAWTSNDLVLFLGLLALSGAGHGVSGFLRGLRFRWGLVTVPAALLVAWMMRADLLTIFSGGSLLTLAKLVGVVQALSSFNLRGLRSQYDSLLLSLAVLLLASEGAMSVQFGLFLLLFGVLGTAFLALAYPVGEARRLRRARPSGAWGPTSAVVGSVILTLAAALPVFLALPQAYRVLDARPLPSRLELTLGRPLPPSDSSVSDPVPWARFLPSRERSAPESQPLPARDEASILPSRDQEELSPRTEPGQAPVGSTGIPEAVSDLPLEDGGYATLGYQGERGKDTVMYVRSPLASYWRGAILDEYDGRGWKASGSAGALVVDQTGRLRFSDTPYWTNRSPRYVQSYFLKVPQPNALFTGYSPGYIALGNSTPEGGRVTGLQESAQRLQQAERYRVVSAIPRVTPDMLRQDTADGSDPGSLNLPAIPPRVRELAESIVAGAASDYDKAARLEQFLLYNYDYDLRVLPLSRSGDVVESFLFDRQAGYCSQFATAMAVMARTVGLPSRVVIGYLSGTYNSLTGVHTVRLQDAHAWVEVKFKSYGWVPFDPTPRPDSLWALDVGYAGTTQGLQQVLRSHLKELVLGSSFSLAGAVAALFSDQDTALLRKGAAWAVGVLLTAAAALLGLAIMMVAGGRGRARLGRPQVYTLLEGRDRDQVRALYRRALRLLGQKGYPPREPQQSPREYIARLQALGLPLPAAFQQLSGLATHALYDPRPLDPTTSQGGRANLQALRAAPKIGRSGRRGSALPWCESSAENDIL